MDVDTNEQKSRFFAMLEECFKSACKIAVLFNA